MKKLSLSFIAAMAAFIIAPLPANAAGTGTGLLVGYVSYSQNSVDYFFIKSTTMSGVPGCNTSNRFVISSADPKFKTSVALVMSAYAAGYSVIALGSGTCTAWANAEDIAEFVIGTINY